MALAEVYRLIDGPIALLCCVSTSFYEPCDDCPDEGACKIRLALMRVREQAYGINHHRGFDGEVGIDWKLVNDGWHCN